MKRLSLVFLAFAALAAWVGIAAQAQSSPFSPGARTLMLAHNAYPYVGKFGDRLDRAISGGLPFAVEEDLVWVDGRSLLIHKEKEAGPDARLCRPKTPSGPAQGLPAHVTMLHACLRKPPRVNFDLDVADSQAQ